MHTRADVLAKITELYHKAVNANEFAVAADLLALAAGIIPQEYTPTRSEK